MRPLAALAALNLVLAVAAIAGLVWTARDEDRWLDDTHAEIGLVRDNVEVVDTRLAAIERVAGSEDIATEIDELRSRADDLESRLGDLEDQTGTSELEATIGDLESRVSDLEIENDGGDLEFAVSDLEGRVSTVEADLSELCDAVTSETDIFVICP